MLLLFTALNLLNYLDRFLLASVLPLLKSDLGLSSTEGGLLLGAFILGYAGASPFVGALDRGSVRRRRLVLLGGIILWSVATIITGLGTNLELLIAARIGVGVGEACFVTMTVAELRERYTESMPLTRAFSVFYAAIPVGAALGYVVGGAVSKAWSWRESFFVGGVPGICLACILLLAFRSSKRTSAKIGPNVEADWREVLRSPMFRVATLGYILQTYALTGISSYVTSYADQLGSDAELVSQIFGGILVTAGILGTLAGGRYASKRAALAGNSEAELLRLTARWTLFACPWIAIAFATTNAPLFYTSTFFAELLVFAGTAPLNVVIVQSVAPRLVPRAQGISIFAINIGGYLTSSLLIGIIADRSQSLPFALQTTTVALVAAGLVWWWGAREQPEQVTP